METEVVSAQQPKFVGVDYIIEMLSCSKSKAYKIIQQLNKELKNKGKIVVSGKVSRRYLEERLDI